MKGFDEGEHRRRASRREARRRWAADLSEDSTSRERVPPRENEHAPSATTPREPAASSSPVADTASYASRRTLAKLPSTTATGFATTTTPSTAFPKSASRREESSKPATLSPPPPTPAISASAVDVPEATTLVDFSRRTATRIRRITPPSSIPAVPAAPTATPTAQVSFVHSNSAPRRSALPSPTPTSPQPTNLTTPPATPHIASTAAPTPPPQSNGLPSSPARMTPPLQVSPPPRASPPPRFSPPARVTPPPRLTPPSRVTTPPPVTTHRATPPCQVTSPPAVNLQSPPPLPATPPALPSSLSRSTATPARREGWPRSAIPTMPGSTVLKRGSRVSPSEKPFMRATSAWTARSGPLPAVNGNAQSFGSSQPLITPPSPLFGTHSANIALQRRMPLQPLRDRSVGQRPTRTKTPLENQHVAGSRWRSSRSGISPL